MGDANQPGRTLILLVAALFIAGAFGAAHSMRPRSLAKVPAPSEFLSATPLARVPGFSFGAIGDLAGPNDGSTAQANAAAAFKRMNASGLSFALALGDLGYTSDVQNWCASAKSSFNKTIVVAGNHDTSESGPGDIAQDVKYCPFNVDTNLTEAPQTPGYGYSYLFDYPASSPLARFIVITPGITGSDGTGYAFDFNTNYSRGGPIFNWVVDSVSDARSQRIPWIIVAMHKMCITVGEKTTCDPTTGMGQAMFDALVDLKVDVILHGHDHVYERSKQLALNANCTSVASGGSFKAACVAADAVDGAFVKGVGSVDVVQGLGGHNPDPVTIDGSDAEIGYYDAVNSYNTNTEGKGFGLGYVKYTLTPTTLTAQTDFCPDGGPFDDKGECSSYGNSTFEDAFVITSRSGPTARIMYSPPWPHVGDNIVFNATASTDSDRGATIQARWDWEDDGMWDTDWSADLVAQHAYQAAGIYDVRLEVNDSLGRTDNASRQVVVDSEPPTTTSSLAGSVGNGGWYVGAVTVTLSATDDYAGVESTQYAVDGAPPQKYAAPFSIAADGNHTVSYQSTDRAGNTETIRTVVCPIDATSPTTAPKVGGLLSTDGTYYVGPVNVTLTATDTMSGVASTQYRVDGGAFELYGSPVRVMGNATHFFEFYSTDNAGNTEPTKAIVIPIGASAVGPVPTLNLQGALGANGWYISNVTAVLTAQAPDGGTVWINYSLDGGAWQSYSAPFSIGPGNTTLSFQASDSFGMKSTVRTAAVKVDSTSPKTAVLVEGRLGREGWYRSRVNVTLSSADLLSGVAFVSFLLDGGSWEAYGTAISLSDGRHTFSYRATSVAGLVEPTRTVTIQVDTTPPRFSDLSPSGVVTGAGVMVSWQVADDVSGIAGLEASVDSGPFSPVEQWGTLRLSLPDGDHTVALRATDTAGNEANGSVAFRIDTNPFSPTGPYSGIPVYLLLELAIGASVIVLWRDRGRRKKAFRP